MIVGKKIIDKRHWHKVFIIWPRQLIDGRWAFIETVERIDYVESSIPPGTIHNYNGWCYRAVEGAYRETDVVVLDKSERNDQTR